MNFVFGTLFLLYSFSIVGARGFYCRKDERSYNESAVSNTERLMQDIMCDGYDSYKRPVKDKSKIIYVNVRFQPMFYEIMDDTEIFRISGFLQQTWTDDLLKWQPSKYGSLYEFKTDYYEIWHPRLTTYDSGSAYQFIDEMDKHRFEDALVKSNGSVSLRSVSTLYGPCESDSQAWPFEEWTCVFTIMKNSDEGSLVQVKDFNPITNINTSDMTKSKVWEIVSDPPFTMARQFSDGNIEISVTVQRNVSHYQSTFVFPGIALLMLSLISFRLTNKIYYRMLINMLTTLVQMTFIQRMFTMVEEKGGSMGGVLLYDFYMDSLFTGFIAILFAILNAKLISKPTDPPQYLTEIVGLVAALPAIGPVFSYLIYEDIPSTVEDEDVVGLVASMGTKGSQKWGLICNFIDLCAFFIIVFYFTILYLFGFK